MLRFEYYQKVNILIAGHPYDGELKKGLVNELVLKTKKVSYGLIELRESALGYAIYVNGEMKEYGKDLQFMVELFDSKYY